MSKSKDEISLHQQVEDLRERMRILRKIILSNICFWLYFYYYFLKLKFNQKMIAKQISKFLNPIKLQTRKKLENCVMTIKI
jgi:hypothetical protein